MSPQAKTRPGRTALITGGNRGLGLETGRQLAREGFRVVLTARRQSEGAAAVAALARGGAAVEFRRLDVSDPSSIATLAAALGAAGETIDVLVNNAAIALNGFDGEVARQTIAVNFFGPLQVTDAMLPLMPESSVVVMVSSGVGELSGFTPAIRKKLTDPALDRAGLVALMRAFVDDVAGGRHAHVGWPSSAYKVSKVGLNALTRILAAEVAPRRIRVNAVCPGWVKTGMGGSYAPRAVGEGAASIVWAALLGADGPTGGFFRDGRQIPW